PGYILPLFVSLELFAKYGVAQVATTRRLIAVQQRAAVVLRAVRRRAMHEQRSEPDDAARRDFERNHPVDVVSVSVHLVRAEAVHVLSLPQAFEMAPRHDFEATVFDRRIVEKENRRPDVMRVLRNAHPVWEVLVQHDRPAVLPALHVPLFREELD